VDVDALRAIHHELSAFREAAVCDRG
jgi:hypothetical protein